MKKNHNIFQLHNWNINEFLYVIGAIQLALLGAIALDVLGVQIPLFRQAIGSLYLFFIPGYLILRILNLTRLNNLESLLLSIGLSVSTLMFVGLLINLILPFLGYLYPISLLPMLTSLVAIVFILCFINYKFRYNNITNLDTFKRIRENDFVSTTVFLLFLALNFTAFSLSVCGTYFSNVYKDSSLLFLMLLVISTIILLGGYTKFAPDNLIPLALFTIAISLLFHTSLISMYPWGTDVYVEYFLSNLVIQRSFWDAANAFTINGMLSIVILAPIINVICNINLSWLFKIIYPLLFALVPVGLYNIYREQIDNRIAFLSCIFFVTVLSFYTTMLQAARQQLAELYLVLIILAFMSKNIDSVNKSILAIIFGSSLIVSHYGTSYLIMFFLIFGQFILFLLNNSFEYNIIPRRLTYFFRRSNISFNHFILKTQFSIKGSYVLLFVALSITWYMYVSNSYAFNQIVFIGNNIASNIYYDFLNPEMIEGLNIISVQKISPLHEINKYLHLTTQLFISIGIFIALIGYKLAKIKKEFLILALPAYIVCLASLAIPYTSLGIARTYQIVLIFLAPFCIIGFKAIYDRVIKTNLINKVKFFPKNGIGVFSIFLVIFLLFNSGFIYEIAKDEPTSFSLNSTLKYGGSLYNDQEAICAQWISNINKPETNIFAEHYKKFIFYLFIDDMSRIKSFNNMTTQIPLSSYIYLSLINTNYGEITEMISSPAGFSMVYSDLGTSLFYQSTICNSNKIYDNGCAQAMLYG